MPEKFEGADSKCWMAFLWDRRIELGVRGKVLCTIEGARDA